MVLTMDLQEVLLAPRVFANANYYKTKLCCHDFTIYNLSNRDVVCYFWHDFTIYNLSNRDVMTLQSTASLTVMSCVTSGMR